MGDRGELYVGFLGGAVAWTGHFLGSYLIVSLACTGRLTTPRLWLGALAAAGMAGAAGAGVAAYRAWRSPAPAPDAGDSPAAVIGMAGTGLAALFLFAIVLGAIPPFVVSSRAWDRWCS
jgi:hypothetical protein